MPSEIHSLCNEQESIVMSLARTSFAKDPMLAVATVSVLNRPRFLCRFTATSLACEEMMRRANNRNPNSKSARKVQQKKVEDVRAAAEIRNSEQKEAQSRKETLRCVKHFSACFCVGPGLLVWWLWPG